MVQARIELTLLARALKLNAFEHVATAFIN